MKGRTLATGFLVALFLAVGLVFWLGATGGGRASEGGLAQTSAGRDPTGPTASSTGASGEPTEGDGAAPKIELSPRDAAPTIELSPRDAAPTIERPPRDAAGD
ncbi:MAG: hypothetical protein KF850_20855 [Labilithrix sp.]|nr:hypothetical protein [Labilithrix sp.]MBX3214499.1 hypothetical protein [Labilithrix sp.]